MSRSRGRGKNTLAGKQYGVRPKVNPAGTKIARQIFEGVATCRNSPVIAETIRKSKLAKATKSKSAI